MLTKDLLDAQTTVELPAREMLGVFNFANVYTQQSNVSGQLGLLNISLGQANASSVTVIQF